MMYNTDICMKHLPSDFLTYRRLTHSGGFSLVELLLVMTIVALVFALSYFNAKKQVARAHDAQRKTDLQKITKAFEEYYNDHGCYPPQTIIERCGSDDLAPYIKEIPCDPITKLPYKYIYADENDRCQGYRLYASLEDGADPAIAAKGCSPVTGCGYGAEYNYGLAAGTSGGTITAPGFDPAVAPTPTPRIQAGAYACTAGGDCNFVDDPFSIDNFCPMTFADSSCRDRNGVFMCTDIANRCKR